MTDKTQAQAAAAASEADPAQFLDQLEGLLASLVPEDGVTVTTAQGKAITLPSALPARQQVKAFRLLRTLLEQEQVQAAMGAAQAGSTANIVDAVVQLATDEAVAEGLAQVFSAAYPDALGGADPLDCLSLEDLVRAVLPFSARFAGQLGAGLAGLLQLQQ